MPGLRPYNTKQREAILSCIRSLGDAHVTAAQIAERCLDVGRTTVYRHLDRLTKDGTLRRYAADSVSGACYQYTGEDGCGESHYHLKCESCGKLEHLACEELSAVERHVLGKHAFLVNAQKTVLYGQCGDCLNQSFEGE
ncbi:MAG: transcriptional repressor [Oscillospiraceae bacterium]|nr:transcriptional repressor [Oscillospiraceae bacterium]